MLHTFFATFGTNKYIVDNFIDLRYTKVQNGVGLGIITVSSDEPVVAGLALDDEVEIWRGNAHPDWGFTPYVDFRGLYRGSISRLAPGGITLVDLIFQHEIGLLQRPINAFRSGINVKSTWSSEAIDDIMEDIIDQNFASYSTDRILDAPSKTITLTSSTIGSVIDYTAPYRNVLTILQELASYDDLVFNVTKTSSTVAAWTMNVYAATIGTDRRASVIFAPGRENIIEVTLDQQQTAPTITIAAGQGDGTERSVEYYQTADFNSGTNQIEQFLDARHLDTSAKLGDFATSVGEQEKYRPGIRFQPLQTPGLHYGTHYFWGDIVTVSYQGTAYVQRVSEVSVNISDREETIQIQTESIG